MKKISLLFFVLLCLPLGAQQNIISPTQSVRNSFAIFVDQATYDACKEEIHAYRDLIEKDGLATYILSAEWQSPEHVKFFLKKYYDEQGLEGAVFVGNIPVPMVRGAQHFTSAFKMDQEAYDYYDSSVPSDRFYDDFDLKFRFLHRDSTHQHLYYYWLTGDSPQRISCDIYTGRIRSTAKGEAGFTQIRNYLRKVVKERSVENPLDVVVQYTGDGSFSNSLIAWKDQSYVMGEQVPAALQGHADKARFYLFAMYPYMKEILTEEMKRDDVDLMLFHEHGVTERQYLTGAIPNEYEEDYFTSGKRLLRRQLRSVEKRGNNVQEAMDKYIREHGIDSTWFEGWNDPAMIAEDSLEYAKTGFELEDIRAIGPNSRVVILDACYNGDFRNGDFIAGEYIFSEGKTIACFGNSVNVLQDKSSTDLMGMLAYGLRIGEWTKNINILESHIIGDPTFRFARPERMPRIKMHSKDPEYWLAVMEHNLPVDIQGLALYKLFELEYEGMSDLLLETYKSSPYYMLRLQCLHLLAHYNDDNYIELLKLASDDPYEFVRRKAMYYMGRVGRNDLAPYMVNAYLEDYLAKRIAFNMSFSAHHLNVELLKHFFKDAVMNDNDFIYDKKEFLKNVEDVIDSAERTLTECWRCVIDTNMKPSKREFYIVVLRNNPFPHMADDILNVISKPEEKLELRIALTEALGWFVRAYNRVEIINGCQAILDNQKDLDARLSDELLKTINRLKEYTR